MHGRLKLFTGNSNPALAQEVADYVGVPLGQCSVGRFSDGEVRVEIDESVRGFDVFVLQSTCAPVNSNILECLIMFDAFRRGSAATLTAVVPYYGYARQDRQSVPRSPITAKLVADLITTAGCNRIIGMDLHAAQIQAYFSVPFDHLYASKALLARLQETADVSNAVIVSPDAGGVERARYYSSRLGLPLAIIDKRRSGPNVAEVMHLIGDVKGKNVYIVDDMIDTAGTLTQAAAALREFGALRVEALATHPVLSGPAVERIAASVLDRVLVTNTIPLREAAAACKKIEVVSVASVIGEAVVRVHGSSSVSSLFR